MKIVSNLFKKANPRPIRSSRRLPIKIRFIVRGRDTSGHVFTTAGETTLVSNNGGRLLFDKDVNEGQNLKLADPNGMSFGVNVRYFDYDAVNNRRVVGFRVIEPRSWGQNDMTHLGY